MKFFEDLTKSVTKVAAQTVKKTEQLTEVAKLKVTLHMEEAKLSKCFEDIGRAYYAIKKTGEDKVSDIASLFIQADEINMTITAIKTELAAINNSVICPRCKTEVPENAAFCAVCGLKAEKKPETVTCDCDCCCEEDTCCEEETEECSCDCDCGCDCDENDENTECTDDCDCGCCDSDADSDKAE